MDMHSVCLSITRVSRSGPKVLFARMKKYSFVSYRFIILNYYGALKRTTDNTVHYSSVTDFHTGK
jgi:hypothetical protein